MRFRDQYCFYYRRPGSFRLEWIEAPYRLVALAILQARGIEVSRIYLAPFSYAAFFKAFQPVSHATLTAFLKQIASLLRVNLPLLNIFQLLGETHPKALFRQIAQSIAARLMQGAPLSEALASHCPALGPSTLYFIKMSENSGSLLSVLPQIIEQRMQLDSLQQKTRQALRYPLLLLGLCLLMMAILFTSVIPQFEPLYTQMNAPLPLTTRWLLNVSSFFQTDGIACLFFTLFILLGILYAYRQKRAFKRYCQQLFYRLPIVHGLWEKMLMTRIFYSLSLGLKMHLPLLSALDYAKDIVQDSPFEHALAAIHIKLTQGTSLYQAFLETHSFSKETLYLIRMGEASGQLAELFSELARLSKEKTNEQIGMLNQLLEPAMMLLIGSGIAFVLMSLYAPILSLGQQIR